METDMTTIRRPAALAASVLILLGACDWNVYQPDGGDGPDLPQDPGFDPRGSFRLALVNGLPLPAIALADDLDTTVVLAGRLRLEDDGMAVVASHFYISHSGLRDTVQAQTPGTWSIDGHELVLEFAGEVDTLTHDGDVIANDGPGVSLRFEREDP
jgi:hypothetical protein